jgi:hypothetical protein
MAIHFKTKTPKKLLAAYKRAIDDRRVTAWTYDSDGDFTHTGEQWLRKAWLRPKITDGTELALYILTPRDAKLTSVVYAVYHGRFIESMLRNCDELFSEISASSMPVEGDFT